MNTRWDRCQRKPEKVLTEVRRACRQQDIDLSERQNGTSHRVLTFEQQQRKLGQTTLPMHGELKKGTWSSIRAVLIAILGTAFIVGCGVLYFYAVSAGYIQ